MQQLEIKYFFPLTEQIALELDYEPSKAYAKELNRKRCAEQLTLSDQYSIAAGGTGTAWATISKVEPSFCIDIDQMPLTVMSKNKPNFLRKYLYKIMGVKWKDK